MSHTEVYKKTKMFPKYEVRKANDYPLQTNNIVGWQLHHLYIITLAHTMTGW